MGELRPLSKEEVGAVQFLWTLRQLLEENPDLELERPNGEIIKTTPQKLFAETIGFAGVGSEGGGATIPSDLMTRIEKLEKQVKEQDAEIGGINDALDTLEGKKSAKKSKTPPATTTEATESRPKPPV